MVLDLVAAGDVLHDARHHLLRQLHLAVRRAGNAHDVVHVRVGHVELARRELGVVRHIDGLVAELTAQLVHAVHSAHHQLLRFISRRYAHLQIQLGGNTHEQIEVEVVVVRNERLRRGASSVHVHHGRLHLDEATLIQERTNASRHQRETRTEGTESRESGR